LRSVSNFWLPVFLLALVQFPLVAQEEPVAGDALPESVVEASDSGAVSNGVSENVQPPETDMSEGDIPETPKISAVPKSFFSFFSLSLGMSVLFFPESDELRSDPMPVLPSPHLALGFPFVFLGSTVFSLEASLDVYMTHYTYNAILQKPVPAAIENRSSLVIGPMAGLHFQGKTGIGPMVSVRYFLGAAFDLRIILIAEDLNEGDLALASANTERTKEYFSDEGRRIFPTAGIGVDFKTAPTFSFGIDGRVWVPLEKLTSGENQSGLDDWRFGLGLHITFLNETPDKVISKGIDRIKKKYAVEENDYAFILYHLSQNPPVYGIEPVRLADVIAKTYRHSGLYTEERAGISSGKIIDMITDVPSAGNDYSYDPMGNVIRKK
jgi:hypothetical protein